MTVEIRVVRFRERFTTCGSCRSAAVAMVMVDDKRFATTCPRHKDLWARRAAEAAEKSAEDVTA